MTKLNRSLLAAFCGVLALVPAAAGANGPTLTEARGASFPDREFVLTLPKRVALDPSTVRVQENGRRTSRSSLRRRREVSGTSASSS
jgi:hypothetical protein